MCFAEQLQAGRAWIRFTPLIVLLLAGLAGPVFVCAKDAPGEKSRVAQSASAASDLLFPFFLPSDDVTAGITDLTFLNGKPADVPITVRDGHFYAGEQRVRFWTALLLSGSCFPSHDEAELVARRLASRGFNQARIHLIDGAYAPYGLFDPDFPGELRISPVQLEKLDYLVAQLKKRGLYVELPVHGYHWRNVSAVKDYAGFERSKFSAFGSGVPMWSEKFIAGEQRFAREFLGHVNPYTGTAYAQEPAVALIEVINENGIICAWRKDHFGKAWPQEMINDLQTHWNTFLRARYETTARLRERWAEGEVIADKTEMLRDTQFADPAHTWYLQVVKPSIGTMQAVEQGGPKGQRFLSLSCNRAAEKLAFVLLQQAGLTVQEDRQYEISFSAKANVSQGASLNLGVSVTLNHPPWGNVGMNRSAAVGRKWQKFSYHFTANLDEENAKLLISPPAGESRFSLADISLRQCDVVGLPADETLEAGNVSLSLTPSDCGKRSLPVTVDFVDFLYDVDRRYFTAMRDFLRDELKCRQPIKGTQVDHYSSYFSQADFDFVDAHGYWQHPHFPHKPWDRKDWTIGNVPMVNAGGETVVSLAGRRVFGKPYNVSEYCHPAPNTFCSEQIPTVTAFAAFQDWDGIGLHSWWEGVFDWRQRKMVLLPPDRLDSFFNIARHPVKLVTLPFGALAFRRGDVAAGREPSAIGVTLKEEKQWLVDQPRRAEWWQSFRTASTKGATWRDAFRHPIGLELGTDNLPTFVSLKTRQITSDTGELVYDLTDERAGVLTVNAPRAKAMIGFGAGKTFDLGDVTLKPGPTLQQGFSVITAAAVHGEDFHSAGTRALLTATGYVENQEMGWNAEKSSVGDQWGHGPVMCEGIPFTLEFKTRQVKAWALDGRGRRTMPVPVERDGGGCRFAFGPRYKTLWYEIEIE